jgi:hypothetical protein
MLVKGAEGKAISWEKIFMGGMKERENEKRKTKERDRVRELEKKLEKLEKCGRVG